MQQASLEDAFMEMTRDSVEFRAHTTDAASTRPKRIRPDGRHLQEDPDDDDSGHVRAVGHGERQPLARA